MHGLRTTDYLRGWRDSLNSKRWLRFVAYSDLSVDLRWKAPTFSVSPRWPKSLPVRLPLKSSYTPLQDIVGLSYRNLGFELFAVRLISRSKKEPFWSSLWERNGPEAAKQILLSHNLLCSTVYHFSVVFWGFQTVCPPCACRAVRITLTTYCGESFLILQTAWHFCLPCVSDTLFLLRYFNPVPQVISSAANEKSHERLNAPSYFLALSSKAVYLYSAWPLSFFFAQLTFPFALFTRKEFDLVLPFASKRQD